MKALRTQVPQIDSLEASDLRRLAAEISSGKNPGGDSSGTGKIVLLLNEVAAYLEAQDEALRENCR
jgi:hypothetical protein